MLVVYVRLRVCAGVRVRLRAEAVNATRILLFVWMCVREVCDVESDIYHEQLIQILVLFGVSR